MERRAAYEMVVLLLEYKADVSAKDWMDALYGTYIRHEAVVRLLLSTRRTSM